MLSLAAAAGLAGCGGSEAQSGGAPVAFKLGTFERSGRVYLGLVLGDTQAVDIAAANAAYEAANASAPKLPAPADMKALIAAYDSQWKARLAAIAKDVSTAKSAPPYVAQVADLRVHPPVRPSLILNAGGNYVEHSEGIAEQQQRAGAAPEAGVEGRVGPRHLGSPGQRHSRQSLPVPEIADGGDRAVRSDCHAARPHQHRLRVRVRRGHRRAGQVRDRGQRRQPHLRLHRGDRRSDRGGRGDRKMGGSDWLVGKNHDTFGPLGPFIVPKEFLKDPMNTRHTFTLNETVMQDSNTSRMSHNIYELLSYASNILTLNPGDVIAGGSPAGTNIERAEPRWMRAGDTAICAIEGVGTQRHPVVGEDATR